MTKSFAWHTPQTFWKAAGGACPSLATAMSKSARTLYIANLDSLIQRGDGIMPLRRRILVSDEAGVVQIRDRLSDEVVVQLLALVDIVTPRVAAGMEMADPLKVIADVADDVAVHDLSVVNVEQDLHPRGVDALHHVHAP